MVTNREHILNMTVGVRPNTIGDLYHERVKRIDLDLLNNICRVLGCDLTDLLEYQPDNEEEK